jgi:isoquinoline 1-oxidoreductase alpha subunit
VLRDVLGTGTKFGGGMALCGACTAHVDGAATRSSVTTIDRIGDSEVKTIEAVGDRPRGNAVEQEVVECGYCQSGQSMSAATLLTDTPTPSDANNDGAVSGNVCPWTPSFASIVKAR